MNKNWPNNPKIDCKSPSKFGEVNWNWFGFKQGVWKLIWMGWSYEHIKCLKGIKLSYFIQIFYHFYNLNNQKLIGRTNWSFYTQFLRTTFENQLVWNL
jgi:hypothetical protein